MESAIKKLRQIEQKASEALAAIPGFVAVGYPRQIREAQEMKLLLSGVIEELEGLKSGNEK